MQSVGGMTLSVSFSRELRIYLPAGLMRNGETGVPKPNRYKPEPAEPPNKYERNMLEGRGVRSYVLCISLLEYKYTT